jgi:phosphoribosyl-AMP cyclohydrolase / phosphoribosyl-ATP pyrophosphohydrolase
MNFENSDLNWEKQGGLIPAIVQHAETGRVLMLGYMNRSALEKTLESRHVTFWSRSRDCLWTKGETSGAFLRLVDIQTDCDSDALLVLALPLGPTCHRGTDSCFPQEDPPAFEFLFALQRLIRKRKEKLPEGSYTTELFQKGELQIAKKLGEEAVELLLAPGEGRQRTVEEGADLLYHLLVFLAQQEIDLGELIGELQTRHREG